MAFSTQRFLHNNLVNADNITASSQGAGTIQQAKKEGTGTALLNPSGSFTGAGNLLYTLQCDVAGSIDGAATFRWRTSATATGVWEATGVSATSSTFTLSNGVQGQFTAGTLVLNDRFQFWAYAENGPGKLFSNDRDDFWKSGTLPVSSVSNGGFDSDTTDWVASVGSTLASVTGGQSGNCLQITLTGGASQSATQAQTTIIGEQYRVSAYVKSGTSGDEACLLSIGGGIGTIASGTSSSTWTLITGVFVATATSHDLSLVKNTATAGTMLFDTVSCYEMVSLLIDFGAASLFTAIVLADHNFSSSANVFLSANSSDVWSSPAYSVTLLSGANTDPSVDYVSETYQYLKFFLDDPTNADGFLSLGKLYVGTYTELAGSFSNIPWGSAKAKGLTRIRNRSQAGKQTGRTYSKAVSFTTEYFPIRDSGDLEILEAVFDATYDVDTGQDTALWLHYWYDTEDTMYFVLCMSDQFNVQYPNYAHYQVSLDWEQQTMTRVI